MMTLQNENADQEHEPYAPHCVIIVKGIQGFGFNVRGQIDEGGQLKSINGSLYPPLQHISNVIPGGPADAAGVLMGDRILEVNGINVEGESHSKVIELIKSNPEKLRMSLMSVPPKENERLDGESVSYCSEDEFELHKVDVTIPSMSQKDENGKIVVYYNVYIDGKFLCSHRYKNFHDLQVDLKNKFFQFDFPKFPGKWPFQLSQTQLEKRHKELEQWLIQVCSVAQLFNHFYIQDFLGLVNNDKNNEKADISSVGSKSEPDNADIKVLLPDRSSICVNIPTESYVKQLIEAICDKINISHDNSQYFSVFKSSDADVFEVPLSLSEKPLELHVQNYNESGTLKFTFKKFIFSSKDENEIAEDPACLNILYQQAVDDLINKTFDTTGKEIELKRTQHISTQREFLEVVQSCPGYNTVSFPHCACDSRKDGHVILSISFQKISIQACLLTGEKQDQIKNFTWATVSDYGSDGEIFHFTISKSNSERKISLTTPFADFMSQSFDRITASRDSVTST